MATAPAHVAGPMSSLKSTLTFSSFDSRVNSKGFSVHTRGSFRIHPLGGRVRAGLEAEPFIAGSSLPGGYGPDGQGINGVSRAATAALKSLAVGVPCLPARALQGGEAPLRIMISGAPASGKGTQCELIVDQYNLAHIATGDLLRAEVAAGTEAGKLAQEYMQKGQLVPNDIVVSMVKDKLYAAPNGWLLDGYPRSLSQAEALEALEIYPQIFILLEVPDEILVQRVVGRRIDPVTGKIYHLMYSPPETPEIAARLTQRDDDTEEKVKLRLQTHASNVQSVLDIYKPVMKVVDGNRPKDQVFADIKNLILELQGEPEKVGAQQVASGGL